MNNEIAFEKGVQEGKREVALIMRKNGLSVEEIAKYMNIYENEVRELLSDY